MADMNLWQDQSNVPFHKEISFKFTVDAGNAPALAANPLNMWVSSVSRVAQGQYRLTLTHAFKNHVRTECMLNVGAAGTARWAQPGPVANVGTSTPVTVDIFIVDNAGAAQNPPAAATDNYVSGVVVFSDIASV